MSDLSGHRERLRAKFTTLPNAIEDYEILELLLFYVNARSDTKTMARNLLKACGGSLRSVLFANSSIIQSVPGVGPAAAFMLHLMREFFARVEISTKSRPNVMTHWSSVIRHCQFSLCGANKEQFLILFLNRKNAVIYQEVIQTGTIDRVAIYPREVAKRCLDHGAASLILVHNHPSGESQPSRMDVEVTRKLQNTLKALEIALHDHIIVCRDEYFSFRAEGLLD